MKRALPPQRVTLDENGTPHCARCGRAFASVRSVWNHFGLIHRDARLPWRRKRR